MTSADLSLGDLRITLNATFARALADIDDGTIDALIEAASANQVPDAQPLLNVRRIMMGGSTVSAFVYFSQRDAYFVMDGDICDTIASYVVLIENTERELAIFKKSCAPLAPLLENLFELASYSDLLNTFDDSRAMIQKLSTREMNVSDKGIRVRSYEAADLKGHMSPHAAGRSIPRFTQVRSKDDVRSIGLTTGRVNQLTDRATIAQMVEWVRETFTLMAKERVNKSFFSTFAQRISLGEVLKAARPASILFERVSIEEHLAEQEIDLWYVHQGRYQKLKPKVLKRFLRTMDSAYEVDDDLKIVGTRNGTLKVNKKTISPDTKALRRLKIKNGKDYITFQSWITDKGYFIVSFDKPEFIYLKKNCFQDRAGRAEVESILKCLKPIHSFAGALSEKGDPKPIDTAFTPTSLFAMVEQIHSGDDYIFCDDLGNEWADHISLNLAEARVAFIHSKHAKRSSNSASALHEVVGQAVKNLGVMHFTHASFSAKVNGKFKNKYGRTRIERTRKGDSRMANQDVKSLLSDHRLHRMCIVACSSISKRRVSEEFEKMKRGDSVRGNVTQLFWILSSFIHSAQGSASVPVVYCKP